jgi:phytoene dehydrogenase-like protein
VLIATSQKLPLGKTFFEQQVFEHVEIETNQDLIALSKSFRADLVVLDVLDTELELVQALRSRSCKVVSFEDLGEGASAADLVVSNVDAYYTYKRLLGDEAGAQKILRNERSSSAFIFYWGMNSTFSDLHLHNIFFSRDYQKEFDHLFKQKTFYNDPTVYVNITSKMEEAHAPQGKENWFVMVNAPAVVDADWSAVTETLRNNVLGKLGRMMGTDLRQYIEVEKILSPQGIQLKTDSYLGSLYGTSSNSKWAAFLRHANFTNKIKGLYFTGGSVHPGGGIPLCLKSAKIVSELIG